MLAIYLAAEMMQFSPDGFTSRTPVEDRTGLSGRFDLTLPLDNSPIPNVERAARVITAVKELGLRLTPSTGPSTVLVVEQVERPDAN